MCARPCDFWMWRAPTKLQILKRVVLCKIDHRKMAKELAFENCVRETLRPLNMMRANAGDNSQKSARCKVCYRKLLQSWLLRIVFARLCEFWMRHAPTQVTILKSHLIARFTIENCRRRSFWEFGMWHAPTPVMSLKSQLDAKLTVQSGSAGGLERASN